MLNKMKWYIKQLFPLTYRTNYTEDGKKHFTVWKMWFGRCYDVEDYVVYNGFEDINIIDENDNLIASIGKDDVILQNGYRIANGEAITLK